MSPTLPSRAVLVLMDGLRPEVITQGHMPFLSSLAAGGAATLAARSVMPSITLPCITSIFLSAPPEVHGTFSNTFNHQPEPLPGLFEMARAAGLLTAAFHGWDPLRDVAQPDVVDFVFYHRSADPVDGDTEHEVTAFAAEWIARLQPGFSFLYIELPDQLGHRFGYLSPAYREGCQRVDRAVQSFVEGLRAAGLLEDTLLLLTADHGGHEHGHGEDIPEDMTVPLILSGPGVRAGAALDGGVSLLDIAPTLADRLQLAIPESWQGRVLREAFHA